MKNTQSVEKWKDLVEFDVNQGATVFVDFSQEEAARIAAEMGVTFMTDVVSRVQTDAGSAMLRKLPPDIREKILAGVDPYKTQYLLELLSYREGTAGSSMAKEYLSVPIDASIGQTIQYLRSVPTDEKGKVSYIYVVDKNNRLEGVIQIRDLVFYSPDRPVKEILKKPVVQVETGMSQLDVAKLLERHRYLGLPVVDEAQKLVGVINASNVMRVFEKEAVSDLAKIVGTSAEEIQTNSVARILHLRLPWLFINIMSGLICAFILGFFENNIQTVAILFLFVPVVLGISESTGVQGATIVVRNMALGDITFGSLSGLFMRESLAGVFIGGICGTIVGAVAYFWKANHLVGLGLGLSMAVTIIISAIIGLLLPFLFKRFKIDPAMASGPLVLAICDVQTLIVYFSLSSMILKG